MTPPRPLHERVLEAFAFCFSAAGAQYSAEELPREVERRFGRDVYDALKDKFWPVAAHPVPTTQAATCPEHGYHDPAQPCPKCTT